MSTIDDYKHAMGMVKEVERGPVSKFSAETRCFADLVRSVDKYHRDRLRSTAQILITETGADGPRNAEVVAADAVQLIKNLRVEVCRLREANVFASDETVYCSIFGSMMARQVMDHMTAGKGAPTDDDFDLFAEEANSTALLALEAAARCRIAQNSLRNYEEEVEAR